jgi:hypothetical protein
LLVTPLPLLLLNEWVSVRTVRAIAWLLTFAAARSFLSDRFESVVQLIWLTTCGPLLARPDWTSVPNA